MMKKINIFLITLFFGGLLSAQNLIVNGDLVLSDCASIGETPVDLGWYKNSLAGICFGGDGYFLLDNNGGSGDPTVYHASNNLIIGKTYELTVTWRGGDSGPTHGVSGVQPVFAIDIDNNAKILKDGVDQGSSIILSTSSNYVALMTNDKLVGDASYSKITFVATSTSHTLAFRGEINGIDGSVVLDDVSLLKIEPIVNIPDAGFKKRLVDDLTINTNGDGEIQISEAEIVTTIDVSYDFTSSILDLTGIEAFINLTSLTCSNNQIVNLDLSKNTVLTILNCSYNKLTSLDLSKNTALTTLNCSASNLTSLDLSKNTALTTFECINSQITALDFSQNIALTTLDCGDNLLLANIDISKNTALTTLNCGGNKLTNLDVSKNTALKSLNCTGNQITTLDLSKNIELTYLVCNNNPTLTSLDISNTKVESLDVSFMNLTNLNLSNAILLRTLNCNNTKLTTLDVSQNIALESLSCSEILTLASIDVSKNTALTFLDCSVNQIASLDVSKNTALTRLNCVGNKLTSLDFSKNIALTSVKANNNKLTSLEFSQNKILQDLNCIENKLISLDLSKNTELWGLDCSLNASLSSVCVNSVKDATFFIKDATTQWIECVEINPDFSIFVDNESNILSGKNSYFYGKTSVASNNVKSWEWTITGQGENLTFNDQNPKINFSKTGDYTIVSKLTLVDGQIVSKTKTVSVKQNPEFFIRTKNDLPTNIQLDYLNEIEFIVKGRQAKGKEKENNIFSSDNLPKGAYLSPSTGILKWKPETEGTFNFTIKAKSVEHNVETEYPVTLLVKDNRMTSSIQVVSALGDVLSGVKIIVTERYYTGNSKIEYEYTYVTDVNGSTTLKVLPNTSYDFNLSKSNSSPKTENLIFTSSTLTKKIIYNEDLEIQNMKFVSDDTKFNKTNGVYTLTNPVINKLISIKGKVEIHNFEAKKPLLRVLSGSIISTPKGVINSSNQVRNYYLYRKLIIASYNNAAWFDLGKVAYLNMKGIVLEADNEYVAFVSYPELPWIMNEYMKGKSQKALFNINAMITSGDEDIVINDDQLDERTQEIIKGATVEQVQEALNSDGKYSIHDLYEQIDINLSSPPKIAVSLVIKETVPNNKNWKNLWDYQMEGLTIVDPVTGTGLKDFNLKYQASDDLFALGFEIGWDNDGNDASDKKRSILNKLTANGDTTVVLETLDSLLFNNKNETATQYQNGNSMYSTKGDEYVDITSEVNQTIRQQRSIRRGLPISGFGASCDIRAGKIDAIEISVDVEIPFPQYGFKITNVTGSVFNLTKRNAITNEVTYNANFGLSIGGSIANIGPVTVITSKVKLTINMFNILSGKGDVTTYGYPLGGAEFLARIDPPRLQVGISASIYSALFIGDIKVAMGSTGYNYRNFYFEGYASLKAQIPNSSIVFPPQLRGYTLGKIEAGITRKLIAGRARVSLLGGVDGGAAPTRWGPISWVKEKVIDPIVEVVQQWTTFDVGISFNFENKKFDWGKGIIVPKPTLRVVRGDSSEYGFDVTVDSRALIVYADNDGVDRIDFVLYNPNNERVDLLGERVYHQETKTYMVLIKNPMQGRWLVKLDKTHQNVNMTINLAENSATVKFESPLTDATGKTQISLKLNDVNDVLDVAVFIDDNNKDYDGALIHTFKVLNNANVKFDYEPSDLPPGKYYFYCKVTESNDLTIATYAKGTLMIKGSKDMSIPTGVKSTIETDSIKIEWNPIDVDTVKLVRVTFIDEYTGKVHHTIETRKESDWKFGNLKVGHSYTAQIMNLGYDDKFSDVVELKNLTLVAQNYPPKMVNYPNKPFAFKENEKNSYPLTAIDPEGKQVTYKLLGVLPKGMTISNDSINWTPVTGDAGTHKFNWVISDGTLSDTIPLLLHVQDVEHQNASIRFSSQTLYENDNLLLNVLDETNNATEVNVKLANPRTKEIVVKKAYLTENGKYSMDFKLSSIKTSDLAVADKDTIYAVYEIGKTAYVDFAIFNEKPQIQDEIAPLTIQDLTVVNYSADSVLLSFTVPSDAVNDGRVSKPWIFDLRYKHSDIKTDVDFVQSYDVRIQDIQDVGTLQKVKIAKSELYNFDVNAETWFNIKSGDSRFNYSAMSNTTSLKHIESVSDVKASVTSDLMIAVEWTGLMDTKIGDFERYNVYKSTDGTTYTFVGTSTTNSLTDSLNQNSSNGNYIYKVDTEYKNAVSEPSYSNQVVINLFADVQVKVLDINSGLVDEIKGLSITISGIKDTALTNSFGLVTFKKVKIGNHTINIFSDSAQYITDNVKVSVDSNFFSYRPTILSLESLDQNKIVYPNPTTGKFTIDLSGYDVIKHVEILDLRGNVIKSLKIDNEEKVFIDLAEESVGLYIITITTENSSIKTKINYTK